MNSERGRGSTVFRFLPVEVVEGISGGDTATMGSTERKRGEEQRKEEGGASNVSHTAAAIFRAKLAPYEVKGGRASLVIKREPERDKRERDDFKLRL